MKSLSGIYLFIKSATYDGRLFRTESRSKMYYCCSVVFPDSVSSHSQFWNVLILSWIMLENGQSYFKNLAMFTTKEF